MQVGAGAECGAREPTRVTQGIQIPAAAIQHRDPVTRRAGRSLEARALQQLDRSAAACQLLRGSAHLRRMLRAYRCTQGPIPACITTNVMALDEIEDERRRVAGEGIHAATQILTVVTLHSVRIMFKTRIDLTAVPARCAPTGFLSLQQHDLCAPLREMQSGRQSGDAPADHDHIGLYVPVEGRGGYRGFRGVLVQVRHMHGCCAR